MKQKLFFYLALSALSVSAYAWEWNPSLPKSYTVQYQHSIGKIDGFVQIPKGGQYGTTSSRRPSFHELDVNYIHFPELKLAANWDKFSLSLDAKYESFKGKGKLNQDLISHDIYLPKNTSIKTKHKYAYYGINAAYDFPVSNQLVLSPSLGIKLFDFSYRFSATDELGNSLAQNDTRAFHSVMTTLGLKADYQFSDKLHLIWKGETNIPYGSVKQYYDTSLMLSYNVYKNNSQELNLLGGLAYERLQFRDSQKNMQNFMQHNIAPIYKVGFEFKF